MAENQENQSNKFEMVLHSAMELPGVKINRANFLRKALSPHFGKDVVEKAIVLNPAQAGLSPKDLAPIARACINYETTKVSGISALAGIPGGFAIAATLPADMAQFFGHIIRILQKLAYLYGWPEMFRDDHDGFDDAMSHQLILFIGVMFGVDAANKALVKIAHAVAIAAEKKLIRMALTQTAIYPIVKKVAGMVGVKLTKATFAKGVGKAIPLIGALASGGITYAMFKPMSNRLENYLIGLPMASTAHYQNLGDDIIDVDFSDVTDQQTTESER
ncbi:MAG: hypothetical protein FWE32_01555 [Oscillospiraceae bacterium]|nr:hypothetical protein [Oscillospiraceae bacterium]